MLFSPSDILTTNEGELRSSALFCSLIALLLLMLLALLLLLILMLLLLLLHLCCRFDGNKEGAFGKKNPIETLMKTDKHKYTFYLSLGYSPLFVAYYYFHIVKVKVKS